MTKLSDILSLNGLIPLGKITDDNVIHSDYDPSGTPESWAMSLLQLKTYIQDGLLDYRGDYDASVNAYPSTGGSGVAGAILKGDTWRISVAGTLPTSQPVDVGDTVTAIVDGATNTQADWLINHTHDLLYWTEASAQTGVNASTWVSSFTALGTQANIDAAIIPKGDGAVLATVPDGTAAGGDKRGIRSVDLQTLRAASTQVASGQRSVVLGAYNTASQLNAVALGGNNTATATNAISIGVNNNVASSSSAAIGSGNQLSANSLQYCVGSGIVITSVGGYGMGVSNTISGDYAGALGQENISDKDYALSTGKRAYSHGIKAKRTHAGGHYGASGGVSQYGDIPLGARTTDATVTVMVVDFNTSAVPSTDNQLILKDDQAVRFKGVIVAKKTATAEAAAWDIDGLIVRQTGVATAALLLNNVLTAQNASGWGIPVLSADTTNGGLKIEVEGLGATSIQWTCYLQTTETIY